MKSYYKTWSSMMQS